MVVIENPDRKKKKKLVTWLRKTIGHLNSVNQLSSILLIPVPLKVEQEMFTSNYSDIKKIVKFSGTCTSVKDRLQTPFLILSEYK